VRGVAPQKREKRVMVTRTQGKEQVVATATKLIAGAAKHLGSTTQMVFLGSSFTQADIVTKLQNIVTLRADVDAAKASTKAKLAAEVTNMPALRTVMDAFVAYVKVTYGAQPDVLADFGITPKARATSTVDAKAGAVAKRKATRAARHTMGTQQKKAVKGDVTGVVVTPITAAQPTVPAPGSPTPPATSGGGPAAPTSPAPSGGTAVSTARMP
jgi:hypothetical protein